jgi:hypothetical protein
MTIVKLISLLVQDIYNSFFTNEKGFSSRKLTAFVGIMTAVYSTHRFVDSKVVVEVITVWLLFSLLCLGIVTMEHIIKFKNEKKDGQTPQ